MLSLGLSAVAVGQSSAPAAIPPKSAPTEASAAPHTSDDPDLVRETQLGVRSTGEQQVVGLIWWIPTEFWQQASQKRGATPEKAADTFKSLRDYTMVGVFLAKVSALGAFEYVTPADLAKQVVLRDSDGVDYAALDNISPDAKNLSDVMRPMLTNAMGRAGENFAMLFFPARTKAGRQIADPLSKGSFEVVLKKLAGEPESVYLWRTPLTSLTPARYCSVGKERVHADWDYCPWHGTKLTATTK